MSTAAPALSIVFASHSLERLKDIFNLLDSIKDQPYPNIETIFVADACPELVGKVKVHAANQGLNLRALLNRDEPGANISRNLGIKNSKGEIVAIVDDDVILARNWAEKMVETYEDPSVIAVTGPAIPLWEDASMAWFPKELYWMWGCTVWDWDRITEIRNVGGMNCSYRRGPLFAAGLYRPDIGPKGGAWGGGKWLCVGGEEVEFCLRLKQIARGRIVYHPEAVAYHKVPRAQFNLKVMAKRAVHFGYTRRFIEELFRRTLLEEPVLKLDYQHLRHIVFWSFPNLVAQFPRRPLTTCKRLLLIGMAVLFIGAGYFAHVLRPYRPKTCQPTDAILP